ncbi:MAG: flagellar hook-basal body complex protein [Alphaproteobacteria bacterium]|nr:flagellar hook-basal body complex protein [Alphaproteobacteria bacterium]
MSLYSALRSSVSNIQSNSQRIDIISNNIANTNSIGYKRVDSSFSTFVTESENYNRNVFSAGGVSLNPIRNVSEQGLVSATTNATDMAISGDGYFAVTKKIAMKNGEWTPDDEILYTRRGDFATDQSGNLQNSDGMYLLAWQPRADNNGINYSTSPEDFRSVNIGQQLSDPVASTKINIGANIIPTTPRDQQYTVQYHLYDTKGDPNPVELTFEKIPAETNTIFFDTPSGDLDKQVLTTVPNGWRVYAKFNDDQISFQTFDGDGNPTGLVRGEDTPIADLMFDYGGRLSNLSPPGVFSHYRQTTLPLNDGTLVEQGSVASNRISLTDARITQNVRNQLRDILLESGIDETAFGAQPNADEIGDAIAILETLDYPDAMPQLIAVLSTALNIEDLPARRTAGYPGFNDGANDMERAWNVNDVPGEYPRGVTNSDKVLVSRLIDAETGNVVAPTASTGILPFYSTNGFNKIAVNIDYDGSIFSDDATSQIEFDFGSMNLDALTGGQGLNRSLASIVRGAPVGTGEDGLTQFDDFTSTTRALGNNGRSAAPLSTVSISEEGLITGTFANGEVRDLAQVPLILFSNPNGLSGLEGLAFRQNDNSGEALVRHSDSGAAGKIIANAVESSSVDLAYEFSNMIVSQRGFSASAKVVSTTQAMIEELSQRL